MPRYVLTCDCGKSIPVEVGQAGGQIVCVCGKAVDVPPLRRLRHLPVETSELVAASSWGPRYGVIAVFLILAAVFAVISLGIRLSEPTVAKLDFKRMHESRLEQIDQLTPAEWWQTWTYQYLPEAERGFAVMENRLHPVAAQQVAKKRLVQKVLLSLAALSACAALIVALWPASKHRRTA